MRRSIIAAVALVGVLAHATPLKDQLQEAIGQVWEKIKGQGVVLRSDLGLSPTMAQRLLGGRAEVNFVLPDGSSRYDTLYFRRYDPSDRSIMGMRHATINGDDMGNSRMVCGKEPTGHYTYLCVSFFGEVSGSTDSPIYDWYSFDILQDNSVSGVYLAGTPEDMANAASQEATDAQYPLQGTFYPRGSTSGEFPTSSGSENLLPPPSSTPSDGGADCLPGDAECVPFAGSGSQGSSSTIGSGSECEDIIYGTAQSYEAGEDLPLPGRQVVYTKEVVDQIIEDKLQQCRQDPRSCGIDALPILHTVSDTRQIYNQIKNTPLSISGYYLHYGSGTFDWAYVPFSLSGAYKLEKGVDEHYHLRWTPFPRNILIQKVGDKIIFK